MARRQIPIREFFLLNANPVIKFMVVADVISYGAAGLLAPIFAIFIADFIHGGGAEVAGVAAAIYLVTKSLFQIPAALVDTICGDKDDFWVLFTGMVIGSLLPLAYLYIDTPTQLYIVQFLIGIATAFTFPSFMALFTRYIEPTRAGTIWGVYFTLTDLSQAATAAIGGVLAATIGFEKVIIAVVVIGLVGALLYGPVGGLIKKIPDCR